MLNSIKRAGFRFRVGTSDPSRGTLVEPKYFQVLGLIWNAYLIWMLSSDAGSIVAIATTMYSMLRHGITFDGS